MKVLITDFVHQLLIDKLNELSYDVTYLPKINLDEVKDIVSNYNVIVINTKTVMNKEMLNLATNLKLIVRLGSGLDIIDLDYAKLKGVEVENTPKGNRNAVAEHALGMLLSLFNNINRSNSEVKQFKYNREKNRGIELEGKTIGIIGFGNNGSQFAKLLSGFDVKILAYDKYKQRFADSLRYVEEADIDLFYEQCDIVSLHIPLTDETKYLVDNEFFEKFEKDIFLINIARGKLVKTQDLITQIKKGKVLGACLDVLENEKFDDLLPIQEEYYKELFSFENVIVTPHVAGWTKESKEKIAKIVFERIINTCPVK